MATDQQREARRAVLEAHRRGSAHQRPQPITISPRPPGAVVPLSTGQEQLWLIGQLMPETPVYSEPVTIHIPEDLDVSALEQSITEFVRRHEIWRTNFALEDGRPVQVIHPTPPRVSLPLLDLRELPEPLREVEATRLATEEARRPFDLTRDPLFRALLARFDTAEYRLYLTLHHIIFDGVGLYQVFLPEWYVLYQAFSHGHPSPLPDLPIQYADYVYWRRVTCPEEMSAEQLSWWTRQLEGAPPLLELPTDHPRPAALRYLGSMQPFALSRALSDGLRALSQANGVTLYMTLVAAFSTLLLRYTGQEDLVIGTTAAGRSRSETQALMGYFLNTLVLRTDLSDDPTFQALLARVREVVLEVHAHQDVPFPELVKQVCPDRDPRYNPLFQTLISLEPPLTELASGWMLTQTDVDRGAAKFDLHLDLDDRPDGLVGRFEYSTDLFEPETIARMAACWQTLLEGIVANPSARLSELPILPEEQAHRMLVEWNATATDYSRAVCVHHAFEQQVRRSPDAVALALGDDQLTYGELNRKANQLAHRLQRLGITPGKAVAVSMERSMEMVVALLGILKAGGYYVPLDPSYPRERLAFMLEDTHAALVLTQQRLTSVVPMHPSSLICLDADWEVIAGEPSTDATAGVSADDVAYVMYTSGSTGQPKGVEIRHRSINRLVFGMDCIRMDERQVLLHMAPISFDASTFELWGALLHGARCVLLPARVPTPDDIASAIRGHGVTTAWLTASLFNALIDTAPEALRGVQQLLTGGEALSVAHIRRALDLLPETTLINGYGPTETTTFACCYPIPRPLPDGATSIPIGRPIGNTTVYILDRHGHPVPVGVPGELYIGGDGVARGYLHQPARTAEKFVANAFDQHGGMLYRTGDLCRYRPDGNIEFIGRIDRQIKIRGFRVEPGEVEATLAQHPEVRDAAVLVREVNPGHRQLIAYAVVANLATTATNLADFLRERLPDYMVPSSFVLLEALPLTPNGKLDHDALFALAADTKLVDREYIAARTPIEEALSAIWASVLGVERVGIHDNFFRLGGDSLQCIQVAYRASQAGLDVTPTHLYEYQTIAELAAATTWRSSLAPGQHPSDQHGEQMALAFAPLVTLQARGSRRPFFFVDVADREVSLYCHEIARVLGPDQPFHVLEMYAMPQIPPTVETLASEQAKLIRTMQPQGPYLLGGFCAGGLLALEMARQLREAGDAVDALLMVDADTAYLGRRGPRLLRNLVTGLGKRFGQPRNRQLDWFLFVRHLTLSLRWRYRQWRNTLGQRQAMRPEEATADEDWALHAPVILSRNALRQDTNGLYDWLVAHYAPQWYPGTITLLRASDEPLPVPGDTTGGWGALAAEVEIHDIPGTHVTCRNEHVHALATCLARCLNAINRPRSARLLTSQVGGTDAMQSGAER